MSAVSSTSSRPLQIWLRRAAASIFIACAAYVAVIFWSGWADVVMALTRIGAVSLCAGTAVCATTFLVRFLRWRWILASLGHIVPFLYNLRVYLAGMALSSTPGKVGETLRSVLLLPVQVPVPRSLAAFVADRLSDVIAVAVLGAAAGWFAGRREFMLEAIAAVVLMGSVLLATMMRAQPRVEGLQRVLRRAGLARWLSLARAPAFAWAETWGGWRPLRYVSLGLAAYGLQALVFAGYVRRVAPDIDAAACIAIFSSSTLIGAASLLPGGLGAMDSALVLQLRARGVAWPDAMGAALALRASTLWFAWIIGLAALMTFAVRNPATCVADRPVPGR